MQELLQIPKIPSDALKNSPKNNSADSGNQNNNKKNNNSKTDQNHAQKGSESGDKDTAKQFLKKLQKAKMAMKAAKVAATLPFAVPIAIVLLLFLLIVSLITTIIYTSPLSLFYYTEATEEAEEQGKTGGDVISENLIKLYEATYEEIDHLPADEIYISYLHEQSNFSDVLNIYTTLAALDNTEKQQGVETDEYGDTALQTIEDIETATTDSSGFFARVKAWWSLIERVLSEKFTNAQDIKTSLMENTYDTMFYYTVRYVYTLTKKIAYVTIYNKLEGEYISDHPFDEDHEMYYNLTMETDLVDMPLDTSTYDAIAYRGYGGGYYAGGSNGSNLFILPDTSVSAGYGTKSIPADKLSFVQQVASVAVEKFKSSPEKDRVLPSLAISQACLESRWGTSNLARNNNNIFGVRDRNDPSGWRRYGSWAECMEYYYSPALILKDRYVKVRGELNYQVAAVEVFAAGYCEYDPSAAPNDQYSDRLIRMINTYGFTYYDDLAQGKITYNTEAAQVAIEYAKSKVGCPYSQAYHSNLSADIFDCSSLVYRAYKQAGIDISLNGYYTAANECQALVEKGCEVNQADLQPGDLIFTKGSDKKRYRSIGHVTIYIGGGKEVSASGTKSGVVTRNVYGNIVGVCRPSLLLSKGEK